MFDVSTLIVDLYQILFIIMTLRHDAIMLKIGATEDEFVAAPIKQQQQQNK